MEVIIIAIGIVVFLVAFLWNVPFRVSNICVGLPWSIFSGRMKKNEKDAMGHSVPIHKPYTEGLNVKPPWWFVDEYSRELKTLPIDKNYQVKNSGTIIIKGTIQYRVSAIAAYRFAEVDEDGIKKGIISELDQIIGVFLLLGNIEKAIESREQISANLLKRFRDPYRSETRLTRKLFGKELEYSEHSYGIEILKANIDVVEPAEDIRKERDKIKIEEYQREAEKIEMENRLSRMAEIKNAFPSLSDAQVLEAVQVWTKQATKNIQDIRISDMDSILKFVGEFFAKK